MELYIWECEGKQEWGTKDSGLWPLWIMNCAVDEKGTTTFRRQLNDVTNLRPAKVVDADAVVIDLKTKARIVQQSKMLLRDLAPGSHQHNTAERIIAALCPTPPVTKTYLKTKQFIKVWKSLDDAKIKELSAARDAARDSAWDFAWDSAWAAAWDEVWFAPWSEAWEAAWDAARDAAWSAAWSADLAVLVKDKITTKQFEILTKPWTSCGLSLFAEDWDEVLNPRITEPTGFGAIVEAKCIIAYPFANWGEDSWAGKWLKLHGGKWQSTDGHQRNWSDLINPTILSEGQK